MNEIVISLLSLVAGISLGAFFFGGLWWTTRRAISSRLPARWILGSLLLRTGVALTGFWIVSDGHLDRLLFCLTGFIVARSTVIRLTREPSQAHTQPEKEPIHAP